MSKATTTRQLPSDFTLTELVACAPKAVVIRLHDSLALVSCRDRRARITRVDGLWQCERKVDGRDVRQVLRDWEDMRRVLSWVAGMHCVDANGDVREIVVGTRVQSGTDSGEVTKTDGPRIHVAWEAGSVTVMVVAEMDGMVILPEDS